jgi:hypothetical protein
MKKITWQGLGTAQLRVGKTVEVKDCLEARVPAHRVKADFGPGLGVKTSIA